MYVDRSQQVGGHGHGRGCDDAPQVKVATSLRKNTFGRGNWKITFTNNEPFPVYLTMAVQERNNRDDFDTIRRDVEVKPGCAASIETPACGNGAHKESPYRLTVRNRCDAVIGVLEGKLHDC